MATRRISDSKPPPIATPTVTAESASPGKSRKPRTAAKKGLAATAAATISEDQRRGMIALSAYLRAERRGFSPEGQAEDWLAAELEVDALLNSGHTAPQ